MIAFVYKWLEKDRFLTVCGQIPLHKLQQLRIHVCHHDLLRTADAAANQAADAGTDSAGTDADAGTADADTAGAAANEATNAAADSKIGPPPPPEATITTPPP